MTDRSSNCEAQMNATPLIDVLLVLLVILILTLPVGTHAVKLDLPNGAAAMPAPTVVLDIDFDGRLHWDGQPLSGMEQLGPKLMQAALAGGPRLSVVPDPRVNYEVVAQVLAAAQRARVTRLQVTPLAR